MCPVLNHNSSLFHGLGWLTLTLVYGVDSEYLLSGRIKYTAYLI